jgi:nucleoside-diphosphate-sugar epimerase
MAISNTIPTTLVVGATGATGRWVVQKLLDQNLPVCVIVRSRDRMLGALDITAGCPDELLTLYQGTVLDLPGKELQTLLVHHNVGAIVSCLGHNMTFQGIWGLSRRRLVKDSVERLVQVCHPGTKFLLMSSDGVFISDNDDRRSIAERTIFYLLRWLIPPHADNEAAAAFLRKQDKVRWVVVRPTDLTNDTTTNAAVPSEYELFDKPPPGGVLFGNKHSVSRSNVAKCFVDLLTNETLFASYTGRYPVIHNRNNRAAVGEITKGEQSKEKTA